LGSACRNPVITSLSSFPCQRAGARRSAQLNGQAHQNKPDKDNLEKALLDAIFDDDSRVWDGRVTKVWGEKGQIIIGDCAK
jgi:Holliday junction resolvase RusA-like endonuclease